MRVSPLSFEAEKITSNVPFLFFQKRGRSVSVVGEGAP
jgi:hypothetical protein